MNALKEWIIQSIQGDFSKFNEDIRDIADILTTHKSNHEIWNMAGAGLESFLIAFSLSLALAYFFMGVLNKVLMFETMKKEMIMSGLIKFVICKVIIQNSSYVMQLIFTIVNKLILQISASSSFQFEVGDQLKESLPNGIFPLMGVLGQLTIVRVILWLLVIIIMAIAYGRLIQIYLYTIFAAIPLAASCSEEFKQTTKNFLLDYSSLCMSGVVILVAFKIVGSILSVEAISDTTLASFSMTFTMFIVLLMVMVSSKSLSNKLLGVS